jgi:hypothetical protein
MISSAANIIDVRSAVRNEKVTELISILGRCGHEGTTQLVFELLIDEGLAEGDTENSMGWRSIVHSNVLSRSGVQCANTTTAGDSHLLDGVGVNQIIGMKEIQTLTDYCTGP